MIRNTFVRAAATLVSGTAIAQLITVAALPALTRLYSPKDFEVLAIYLALLGILSAIACLRFEVAIPLPESDDDAGDLLFAALSSTALVSSAVLVLILVIPDQIAAALGVPHFSKQLWLLPIGVFMTGIYASFQYWANRKRRFDQVALSRLVQAGVGVGVQLGAGLGLASLNPIGLLVGHALYGGAGALRLALSAWHNDRAVLSTVSFSRIRARIAKYRRFPTYSMVEALSNSAAIQVPVILVAAHAVGPEAGFVLLASRVMGAPMQLIGSAISQVYLTRAPEEYRANRLREFTYSIIKPLAIVGIPGIVFLAIIAPAGFALAFGEEWSRAGVLLRWMTPWFILQFVSSPVSMVLHVTGRQVTAMILHIFGLILRTGMVLAAGQFLTDWVAEVYAVSGAIFYGVYVVVVFNATNKPSPNKVVMTANTDKKDIEK